MLCWNVKDYWDVTTWQFRSKEDALSEWFGRAALGKNLQDRPGWCWGGYLGINGMRINNFNLFWESLQLITLHWETTANQVFSKTMGCFQDSLMLFWILQKKASLNPCVLFGDSRNVEGWTKLPFFIAGIPLVNLEPCRIHVGRSCDYSTLLCMSWTALSLSNFLGLMVHLLPCWKGEIAVGQWKDKGIDISCL